MRWRRRSTTQRTRNRRKRLRSVLCCSGSILRRCFRDCYLGYWMSGTKRTTTSFQCLKIWRFVILLMANGGRRGGNTQLLLSMEWWMYHRRARTSSFLIEQSRGCDTLWSIWRSITILCHSLQSCLLGMLARHLTSSERHYAMWVFPL